MEDRVADGTGEDDDDDDVCGCECTPSEHDWREHATFIVFCICVTLVILIKC